MPAREAPHFQFQDNPESSARQIPDLPHTTVVPARLNLPAASADRFFERRSRLTIRAPGSPNTPRTASFARKPPNEYPSDRRRRRFALSAIPHLAEFANRSNHPKANIHRHFPAMSAPNRPLDSLKTQIFEGGQDHFRTFLRYPDGTIRNVNFLEPSGKRNKNLVIWGVSKKGNLTGWLDRRVGKRKAILISRGN
jgi:hypothetical protein